MSCCCERLLVDSMDDRPGRALGRRAEHPRYRLSARELRPTCLRRTALSLRNAPGRRRARDRRTGAPEWPAFPRDLWCPSLDSNGVRQRRCSLRIATARAMWSGSVSGWDGVGFTRLLVQPTMTARSPANDMPLPSIVRSPRATGGPIAKARERGTNSRIRNPRLNSARIAEPSSTRGVPERRTVPARRGQQH